MKKQLLTTAFFLLSAFSKMRARTSLKDIAGLRMKLLYLKLIKTSRMLFISFLGVGLCLLFLCAGLVLAHVVFFAYMPWSNEAKIWVGFAMSAIYVGAAAWIFSYVFDQHKWIAMFQANGLLDNIAGDMPYPQNHKNHKREPVDSSAL